MEKKAFSSNVGHLTAQGKTSYEKGCLRILFIIVRFIIISLQRKIFFLEFDASRKIADDTDRKQDRPFP